MKVFYTAIVILFVISGCAGVKTIETRSEGNKIDKSMVESIKPGVTTKKAIIEIFGNPAKSIKKDDEGEELIYNYVEKKVPSYFCGFIANEKNASTTTTTLEIIVKDDVVLGYKLIKTAE